MKTRMEIKADDVRKLPKVGDRLMRIMSSTVLGSQADRPERCIVTYVNKEKSYYQVMFEDSGIKECYRVPDEIDILGEFKERFQKSFKKSAKGVYVFESGALYPTISECAKAIGSTSSAISAHLHGRSRHVKGYHIYMLD